MESPLIKSGAEIVDDASLLESYLVINCLVNKATLDNSSTTFLSHGGALELGFSYILFKSPLVIMFDLGGSITYSQAFFWEKNSDAKLSSEKGLVSPTWAGYKVGFTLKYDFNKF